MGIEVLPATGRWDDFTSFMAPRTPGGRGCVCMVYRNSSLDMPGRIAHMCALCASEPGPGVLAYVDGEVAGWCSAAPKSTYRALVNSRTIPHVRDEDAWSVVCFVVRPGFRRRGLMHQLLDGAVRHAHARGATALEGYPEEPGSERTDQTSGYVGTVQLFRGTRIRARPADCRPARRQAPLARAPRASLTSPAACFRRRRRCPRSACCPRAGTWPSVDQPRPEWAFCAPASRPDRNRWFAPGDGPGPRR
jgi:GNAT superfamily N-acetyltransferase